jgi:transposase
MKCKRSSDGRQIEQSGRPSIRRQALKAIENGQAVAEVAKAFGVAERTLYRWLSRFASEGQQGLTNQPKSGRPPKLDGEEMAWLARTVREETPQQLKFPYHRGQV